MAFIGKIQQGATYANEFRKGVAEERAFKAAVKLGKSGARHTKDLAVKYTTTKRGRRGLYMVGGVAGIHEINKFRSSGRNGIQPTASGGYQGMY